MRRDQHRCQLLVSVRSAEEAAIALAGGADLIDVKEPNNGSLGRAADSVIGEIVQLVAGRVPVSAALGEILFADLRAPVSFSANIQFLKWGLAGCHPGHDWRELLRRQITLLERAGSSAHMVAVAYADWQQAQAPPLDEIVKFACGRSGGVLLIDTFTKVPGKNLLNWLSLAAAKEICRRCQDAGARVALAGSLGRMEINDLVETGPDWFAVRGAACREGRRSLICPALVHELKLLVQAAATGGKVRAER